MRDEFDAVDRERGILTKRDRNFLLGNLGGELNQNEKNQKRYQIRNRIKNAMYDFWFLNKTLPPKDIGMLWSETDDWISRSRRQRRREEAPPYPDLPFLAECWRELIAFLVYGQLSTSTVESKLLVEWILEEGVNKGVRRHYFDSLQMYQEVDSTLDWGVGEKHRLQAYLSHIAQQLPADTEEAEQYLYVLTNEGHLQEQHRHYLSETYIDN